MVLFYLSTYLPISPTCLHRLPVYIAYLSASPTCLHLSTCLYLPTR